MKEIKFLPFGKNGITNQPLPEKSAFNGMTKHSSVSSIKSGVKALVALACFGASTMMNASNSMCPEISEVMAATSVNAEQKASLTQRFHTFTQIVFDYQTTGAAGTCDCCCFKYSDLSQCGGPLAAYTQHKYVQRKTISASGTVGFDLSTLDEGVYVFCIIEPNGYTEYKVTASTSYLVRWDSRIDNCSFGTYYVSADAWVNVNDRYDKSTCAEYKPKLRISYRGNRCTEQSLDDGANSKSFNVTNYPAGDYDLELVFGSKVKETKSFSVSAYTTFTDDGLNNKLTMKYRLKSNANSKVEMYYYNNGKLETNSTATFELGTKSAYGTYTFNTVTWKAGTYCARIYEGTTLISQKNVKVSPVGPAPLLELTNNTKTKTMSVKYKLHEGAQPKSSNICEFRVYRTKDLSANSYNFMNTPYVFYTPTGKVSGTLSFSYENWNSAEYSVFMFVGGESYPEACRTFKYTYDGEPDLAADYNKETQKVTLTYSVSASEEDVIIKYVLIDDNESFDFQYEDIKNRPAAKLFTIKPYQKRTGKYTFSVAGWSDGVYFPFILENGTLFDAKGPGDLFLYSSSSNARSAVRGLDDIEEATAIESISTESVKDGKRIENGKVVIYRNGVKYNISGQQIKE